jgi:LCP family protein required for cell wall assembly
MSDAREPRHASERIIRLLVVVTASLSLVAGVAFAATAVRWYTLRHVGTVADFPLPSSSGTPLPTGPCSERACNYLLLGSDSRAGLSQSDQSHFGTNSDIGGEARADTIMVVHTDPALSKAIVLSFPRDLWVPIPGHGMNKINAAFEGGVEGGGPGLMAETITKLTGIPIDHFLYVDLNGFQQVVNTLHGVDLCIPSYNVNTPGSVAGTDANGNPTSTYYSEVGHIVDPNTGLDVLPGCQHLDGTQALAYVRSRHLRCDTVGDFARIGRQQQFMRALINQMLKPSEIAKAPALVGPVLRNLRRDDRFLPGDLVNLVGQLKGLSTGSVEFRAVPGTHGWRGSDPRLSVVLMDPAAREIFAAIRQGKPITGVGTELELTPPSEANTTVLVSDAGNPTGATQVEDILTQAGFDISPGIRTGNVPKGVKAPVIVYQPGQEDYAKVVHAYFPALQMQEFAGLKTAPVTIVVPPDYHPASSTGGNGSTPPPTTNDCPTPSA